MPLTLPPVLAASDLVVTLLAIAFVAVSVFMMMVILVQKPKGGGLSGAFGGAGGSDTSFVGAKVGDFLTWLTVICFVVFLLLGMGLTWAINPTENQHAATSAAAAGAGSAGATADDEDETEDETRAVVDEDAEVPESLPATIDSPGDNAAPADGNVPTE